MKVIKKEENPLIDMIGEIILQQEEVLTADEKSRNPFFARLMHAMTDVYQANHIHIKNIEIEERAKGRYFCRVNDDIFIIDLEIQLPKGRPVTSYTSTFKSLVAGVLLAALLFSCSGQKTLTGKQQVAKDQKERTFKGW